MNELFEISHLSPVEVFLIVFACLAIQFLLIKFLCLAMGYDLELSNLLKEMWVDIKQTFRK